MTADIRKIIHPFPPLFDENSHTLILGSFPSVKSRETDFYYGHPQNRFWKVIPALFGEAIPLTVPQKKALILRHGLALWDSIASCTVTGSSDAAIRDEVPNDMDIILRACPIGKIFCNGRKSFEIYEKLIRPQTGIEAVCLPSTSPANAQWTMEKLVSAWSVLLGNDIRDN